MGIEGEYAHSVDICSLFLQVVRTVLNLRQLDRLLRDVIMDRRAVIFTSLESAQAIDEEFSTQLSELNFDVEGQAPRLELKGAYQAYCVPRSKLIS